jgi:hypothetical protein
MNRRNAAAGFLAALAAVTWPAVPGEGREDPAPAVGIEVVKDEAIVFRAGKELVTRYHIAPTVAKPYFWPLIASNGVPLTRAWPMDKEDPETPKDQQDHVHQKSAWFCHGDVIPEGIELKQKVKGVEGVDFWSETPGHGTIVCTKVDTPHLEKGHGWVATANEWRTADGVKVLDEARTIHLYDLPEGRLLVLDIDLKASVVPITFGDTKEGSLGIRIRTPFTEDKGKGRLTNAEGKTGEGKPNNVAQKGCWGLVSAWCDYSGEADDKKAGLAIFADPTNPTPTAWHSRGYGLMAANPFGRAKSGFPSQRGNTELVHLAKGEHLKMRYGLFLHAGDVTEGKVAAAYERFTKLK